MAASDNQNVNQSAQQAAQKAAQQVADQVAATVSQAVRQAMGEATRQVIDATRTAVSQEVGAERESETGLDDYFKSHSQLAAINAKRSYDEYQHESLESIRRNRTAVDRMAGLSVDADHRVRAISEQALQNAVETANLVSKQAVRHGDLSIDRQWNVDEVASVVAKTPVFQDAIAAGVAAAVAAATSGKSK